MDFTDVVNDLIKMEGLRLNSIRPGAEIVIEKVDIEQSKITIRNSSGKIQNRYFAEMQRIWDALLANPMIRVEDILNGSGSSRNQPETIFANLPYIEWLKVNNKKHIAYVSKATHSYGTLRQMDSIDVDRITAQHSEDASGTFLLIVTDDIANTAAHISSCLGISAKAIAEGVYEFMTESKRLVLTSSQHVGLKCGIYYDLPIVSHYPHEQIITLFGKNWKVCAVGSLNIISRA